jgi:hypothetical protein
MRKLKALFLTQVLLTQVLALVLFPGETDAARIGLSRLPATPNPTVAAADDDEDDWDDWDDEWGEDDNGFYGDEEEEEPVSVPSKSATTTNKQTTGTSPNPALTTKNANTTTPTNTAAAKTSVPNNTSPTTNSTETTALPTDAEIQKQIGIDEKELESKYNELAKTTSRPKEDIVRLYSQYGTESKRSS